MYVDVGSTPEDFLRARELGYTAAKTTPLSPQNNLVQPTSMIREAVRKLEAIRKAVGEDFPLRSRFDRLSDGAEFICPYGKTAFQILGGRLREDVLEEEALKLANEVIEE